MVVKPGRVGRHRYDLWRLVPGEVAVAIAALCLWVPYNLLTKQFLFLMITAASVPGLHPRWRNCRKA